MFVLVLSDHTCNVFHSVILERCKSSVSHNLAKNFISRTIIRCTISKIVQMSCSGSQLHIIFIPNNRKQTSLGINESVSHHKTVDLQYRKPSLTSSGHLFCLINSLKSKDIPRQKSLRSCLLIYF